MQQSVYYSVDDMKVYPLTSPVTPAYGAAIDVPGISEVTMDASVVSNMLRGDNRVLHKASNLDVLTMAFTYGKLAPAVLSVIDGGSASQNAGGTTDRYVRKDTDAIPEWGFAALVSEVDNPGGAVKIYGYRGRMTGAGIFGAADQTYGQPTFDADFYGLDDGTGAMFAVDLEDVAAALPADSAALIATFADLV